MIGGDPIYFNPVYWTQRVFTMDDKAILTKIEIKLISDFITYPLIKANIVTATNNYFNNIVDDINKYEYDYYTS